MGGGGGGGRERGNNNFLSTQGKWKKRKRWLVVLLVGI
jgi:hypothetical protein